MASEQQLRAVEAKVDYLYRFVTDTLYPAVKAALQGVRGTYQQPTTSTSGGGGAFVCVPISAIGAASDIPGVGTPGGPALANIYQIQSGAYALVASSAYVYNAMLSATTVNHVLVVLPNGDGSYLAVSQSCA